MSIDAITPARTAVLLIDAQQASFSEDGALHTPHAAEIESNLVAGLMTQDCSVTTARHAHDLDSKVIFVSDANAGPDLPDLGFGAVSHADAQRMILTMLAGGVADIQTTAGVVSPLEG